MSRNRKVQVASGIVLIIGLIVVVLATRPAGESKRFIKGKESMKKLQDDTDRQSDKNVEQSPLVKQPQAQGPKQVRLDTTMGEIVIELDEKAAPVTVDNFLRYVGEGFYDGTIFHRVINGFMIQGGGFGVDMAKRRTGAAIVNEGDNGLKNDRGTTAMARTNDPDSATSQFFINHRNNDFLNYSGPGKPGYAVFGKVIKGMDIVDAIAGVKTTSRSGMSDVPVEPVVIQSARIVSGSDGL